jgi:hypothetical protein
MTTTIETAAREPDRLDEGISVGVSGRQATGVIYDTYLVE